MSKIADINLAVLIRTGRLTVPPLEIRIPASPPNKRGDVLIDVIWRGRSHRFVAELRRDTKPQTLKMAIERIRHSAGMERQARPMIIAPYFSQEKLDQLLAVGISAIDFSGNAAVEAPGGFLFYKTGNPNKYPDSSPIRSAYRGNGSLVARVMLMQRQFQAVGDILASIRAGGGTLTMGMVSKVLHRLEADLAIERPNRNAVRVIQPERLLEGLLDAYQPPKTQDLWLGKVTIPAAELLGRLRGIAAEGGLVRTGEASAVEYAAWAGEPITSYYCRTIPTVLLAQLGAQATETRAFANLRLIQTQDQLVYFDTRPNLTASPIQAWLEMASGDERQKEVAEQIRGSIEMASAPFPGLMPSRSIC